LGLARDALQQWRRQREGCEVKQTAVPAVEVRREQGESGEKEWPQETVKSSDRQGEE
jgi:hypothetical protein